MLHRAHSWLYTVSYCNSLLNTAHYFTLLHTTHWLHIVHSTLHTSHYTVCRLETAFMCSAARVPWEGEHSALLPKQREESSGWERIVEIWSFWASFVPQVNYIFVLEYVALEKPTQTGNNHTTIKPHNRLTVWPSDQSKRILHAGSVSPSSKTY